MSDDVGDSTRRDELTASLAAVRERVERACEAAARSSSAVTLVVVTKTFPVSDVDLLAGAGVRDVGEARAQELLAKQEASAAPPELRWHFLGRLQRNKARAVGAAVDVVHSVDDVRLLAPLVRGAEARAEHRPGSRLGCFVQVSLDGDPGRGGAPVAGVAALCDEVAAAGPLELLGLMAVAPQGEEPAAAFARLMAVSTDVRRSHPQAGAVSAGMSGDLEAAVAAGATHLRVGAAVLGSRPALH